AQLEDARIALDELRREPATGIFAPAGSQAAAERALFRSILVPLLVSTAEACGGFDWEDGAFERVYGELEESLFGDRRIQAAAAPLVGVSLGAPVELARGLRVRVSSAAELAARWSGGREYLPDGFGDERERSCVLELEREVEPGVTALPDAAGELADAVTALRLATGAGIAAGA